VKGFGKNNVFPNQKFAVMEKKKPTRKAGFHGSE